MEPHILMRAGDPGIDSRLREQNEARAFAVWQAARPAQQMMRALGAGFAALHGVAREIAARRRARARLAAMSDWQLEDIGLTRGEIAAAVHGGRHVVNRDRGVQAEVLPLGRPADGGERRAARHGGTAAPGKAA